MAQRRFHAADTRHGNESGASGSYRASAQGRRHVYTAGFFRKDTRAIIIA